MTSMRTIVSEVMIEATKEIADVIYRHLKKSAPKIIGERKKFHKYLLK